MKGEKILKRPLLWYFIFTYLGFWILLALTGAVISLNAPKPLQYVMPVLCSWTPTFVFILLYKKLISRISFGGFLRQQFQHPVKALHLLLIVAAQAIIFLAAGFLVATGNGNGKIMIISASFSPAALSFLDQLIRGPLGEELGWRGYALNELQKRFSPLSSAIILGLVWGFWHTPLWLLTSGYSGLNLVKYIGLFMVSIVSVSIIITAFYNTNKNLAIPIIIHLLFNFSISLISADALRCLYFTTPLYLVFALILLATGAKTGLGASKRHIDFKAP